MKNELNNKSIKILAIETSCDETAASLLQVKSRKLKACLAGRRVESLEVLSNIISSQVKLHAKYGGVYPELASREHVKNIIPVIKSALSEASIEKLEFSINTRYQIPDTNFDYIAVTTGPGLIGSLLVGVNTAKTLSYTLNKPIYTINHLEGHIYSNFIRAETKNQKPKIKNTHLAMELWNNGAIPQFPLVALIVSGGHTSLVYMKNHLDYKVIGETLDDAAGEAFDKVAKLLNLGYPGGLAISALAEKFPIFKSQFSNNLAMKQFSNRTITFPRPMIDSGDFDFSFSGLKTSVLYTVKKLLKPLSSKTKMLICKEFQDAVAETLVEKTIRAAKKYKAKSVLLCGGVASNDLLRKKLKVESEKLKVDFFVPEKYLCTDNAAMIAAASAYKIALGIKPDKWYDVNADSNLKLAKSL